MIHVICVVIEKLNAKIDDLHEEVITHHDHLLIARGPHLSFMLHRVPELVR